MIYDYERYANPKKGEFFRHVCRVKIVLSMVYVMLSPPISP